MIGNLKPYPAMKDSGVPWLGKVPEHWNLSRMKRLLHERVEKGFPNEPLLAATQTKGVVKKEQYENRTVLAMKDLHLLKLVRMGDFVISLRSFQGGIEYAREQGIISPAYTVLYPAQPETHLYLAWLFKSKPYVENLSLYVTGIRQGQNIAYEKLSRSELPLPMASEQTSIVRFLVHYDRKIRRYIRVKQKLIKLLEEEKQAIIHRAVTRGLNPNVSLKPSGVEWLGDIPEHWDVKKLKYLVDPVAGIQMGPFGASLTQLQTFDTGFKLFGQENTISGDFQRGTRWLTESQFCELQRYKLRPGDLVLTRKGSIGKCRIIPDDAPVGIADSDTIRVRIRYDCSLPQFIVMLLHYAPYLQFQIQSVQRGAVLGGLNTRTIAGLQIAVPPIAEQALLLDEIERQTKCLDKSIGMVDREMVLLRAYRTRLIADVVTGKLEVREAAAKLPEEPEEPELVEEIEEQVEGEEETEEADLAMASEETILAD